MWCIGELNAAFMASMEQVLYLYALKPDPLCPLVCFDEKSYQIVGDVLIPLKMKPGKIRKESEKYKRNGVVQILVAFLPNWGLRFVWVSPKRRAYDFATFMQVFMKEFISAHFPNAKGINMVCDNLNTHTPASFYKTFNSEQAFELTQKIHFNFTPVNGSWLNMAEIEIHALSTQCLNRRLESQKIVTEQIKFIVNERNEKRIFVNWQFSIDKARDKFSRFYNKLNS